jgi:predicted metal-dependent phosphoesterase TrpH
MKVKANLHLHTKDDKDIKRGYVKNIIANYSLFEALDKAKENDIKVLAVTCHDFVVDDKKYYDYAKNLGIFLIPGIEKTIENCHILILNTRKEAEKLKTFKDLIEYKAKHPEIFFIAPHPFFFHQSLGNKLYKYINIFDAIEWSWFYFKFFNLNKKAKKIAEKFNLPLIATSDTHNLNLLDKNYIILDIEENTKIEELSFYKIKELLIKRKYENYTQPAKLISWDTWNWIPFIKKIQKFLHF